MDIMYNQTFTVAKKDLPVYLPFESVIFVMEDIDAQSPIVRSRSRTVEVRRARRLRNVRASAKAAATESTKVAAPP